jgi:hypothetical protein
MDLACTERRLGGIHESRLVGCLVGPQASKALEYHFDTLVKLDFAHCKSVPGSMIRDVLCRCPTLEILSAGSVYASDMAQDGPWVCQ